MFARPQIVGKCPRHPAKANRYEIQTGRTLLVFQVARHAEQFFCALFVETPAGKLVRSFESAKPHTTAGNAFNDRLRSAIDFVEPRDPVAIEFLRRWSPVVTLAE